MTLSLSIAHTYQSIEIALCNGDHCIDRATEETGHASKHLIPLISSLLEKNQVTLKQIQWIAVNQGPGPFTTLRVMIASVNGLSFATGIPLIGIDGIRALLAQYPSNQTTIALLDAFNKDVYYGIQTHDGTLQTGYENINQFCQMIAPFRHQKVMLIGNGAPLYQDQLILALGDSAQINSQALTASVAQIAKLAYEKWQQKEGLSTQLFPLYLKKQQYRNQQGQLKSI